MSYVVMIYTVQCNTMHVITCKEANPMQYIIIFSCILQQNITILHSVITVWFNRHKNNKNWKIMYLRLFEKEYEWHTDSYICNIVFLCL